MSLLCSFETHCVLVGPIVSMSPLFLFSIPLGMNQTTYVEVLGWTQSNSYCLIFFKSGKLDKWTGSKCALASVCSGTQRIWNIESEMESRSGLYGLSQGQVKGSVDHVRHLKKSRERTAESISGSWAEVFPASPVPPLSRRGTDLLSHLLRLSCPVQQHCQRHRCGNCAYQTECGTKIPLANLSPSMILYSKFFESLSTQGI